MNFGKHIMLRSIQKTPNLCGPRPEQELKCIFSYLKSTYNRNYTVISILQKRGKVYLNAISDLILTEIKDI